MTAMTGGATTTQGFFDPNTWTVTYVVWDHATRCAAVVDPVLDYDFKSGHTSTASADRVLAYLRETGLKTEWILETHAHADHLSGARYLQERAGGRIAIGENIRAVQAISKKLYNFERSFLADGSQFDHLFKDGETFRIGEMTATALWCPGTRLPTWPIESTARCSSVTRCSCRTWAPRVPTFPAAMHRPCIARYGACWICRPRRGCTSATTIRPTAGR